MEHAGTAPSESTSPPAGSARPTGLVTFLFTDIEGSTKLWEKYPEEMKSALAQHDRILATTIVANGGVVFKTVGDAFCAAFSSAPEALLAAVDLQRELANAPWGLTGPLKARTALHSGRADERANDYFGPTVNRVARLLSTGHGGQILVSEDTRKLLSPALPQELDLKQLGQCRLKDLARPEQVFQCVAPGLPSEFKPLKGQPAPYAGIVAPIAVTGVAAGVFSVANRPSGSSPLAALSPVNIFNGFKGLLLELSTYNEWVLLTIGAIALALAVVFGFLRWRRARAEVRLQAKDRGPIEFWLVNQLAVALFAVVAIVAFGSWGYQQYLWNVALPIPDGKIGIAMTREASAATIKAGLADALYVQGQSRELVIRQLPVKFDASDTGKARTMGKRIGAEAVLILQKLDTGDAEPTYVAYLVFTNPSIGLALGDTPDTATAAADASAASPVVLDKQGVQVPVLRTSSLTALIDAAAGIIAYNDDRLREAIKHLELALPPGSDSPMSGLVAYYLGNAYGLDGQAIKAAESLQRATGYYEAQIQADGRIGPQDELILIQSYLQLGRNAALEDKWDEALTWYQKAMPLREDLLARRGSLERPSDVRATYARLFSLMADAYRAQGKSEDESYWRDQATAEIAALKQEADPADPYPLVQAAGASYFAGDCVSAQQAVQQSLVLDPASIDALIDQGILSIGQGRPDLAVQAWNNILLSHPDDVTARVLLAGQLTLRALGSTYFDPGYLIQAAPFYQQIITIDPTNLSAYDHLADLAELRLHAAGIDATALTRGDSLDVAVSQALWSDDPAHRQTALEAASDAIEARRTIASQLDPGNSEAEAAVAMAYVTRAGLTASRVVGGDLMESAIAASGDRAPAAGVPATVRVPTEVLTAVDGLLADIAQIREWSAKVLSNPHATRLAILEAWQAKLQALEWEWTWNYYTWYANDPVQAATLLAEWLAEGQLAVAFVESAPFGSTDELAPAHQIYVETGLGLGVAGISTSDGDFTRAWLDRAAADVSQIGMSAYMAKADALAARLNGERAASSGHFDTQCREERERIAGDDALAKGDLAGAGAHYAAALAANPAHVPALVGASRVRIAQGDLAGAQQQAEAATVANPADPEGWAQLALVATRQNDGAAAATAVQKVIETAAGFESQRRFDTWNRLLDGLDIALNAEPALSSAVIAAVQPFVSALPSETEPPPPSLELPALYAQIGRLLLLAGDNAGAESLLRTAIQLNPHQPVAAADLALSVAFARRDASAETDAAGAETADPFWTRVTGYDGAAVFDLMTNETQAIAERLPEHQAEAQAVAGAIAAARTTHLHTQAGAVDTSYASPNFGFKLTWDTPWAVREALSGTDFDGLELTDGSASLQVAGSSGLSEVAGCMSFASQYYEHSSGWTAFAPAIGADGQPYGLTSETRAAVALTFANAGVPSVLFVQCAILTPGASGLLVLLTVPNAEYEAKRPGIQSLLDTLQTKDSASLEITLPALDLSARTGTPAPVATPVAQALEPGYTSPTFGFTFGLPAGWRIGTRSSQNGIDAVVVTDNTGIVLVSALQGFGSAAQCGGAATLMFAGDATMANVHPGHDSGGGSFDSTGPGVSRTLFAYDDVSGGGNGVPSIAEVWCADLEPQSLMILTLFVSETQYAAAAASTSVLLATLRDASGAPIALPPPADLGFFATPVAAGDDPRRTSG